MKESSQIDVAVLLIFFNRPEKFKEVFAQVQKAKPSKLFLYQDGARLRLHLLRRLHRRIPIRLRGFVRTLPDASQVMKEPEAERRRIITAAAAREAGGNETGDLHTVQSRLR